MDRGIIKRTLVTTALALLAGPGSLFCQKPSTGPNPQAKTPSVVVIRHYSPADSRKLFPLCDLNRDDRINFREAKKILGIRSPEGFRPWDKNSDGWLHFPEFDQCYRQKAKSRSGFILYGKVAGKAPRPKPKISPILKTIFTSLDLDKNGRVAQAEWKKAPPSISQTLAIPHLFTRLDANADNLISLQELESLTAVCPNLLPAATAAKPLIDPKALPHHLQKADRDQDRMLSWRELELVLRQVDPALARFTVTIISRLDKNQDQLLSPREIRSAETTKKH